MIVRGTYFQNDPERPLVYGDVEIENVRRQRLRGEEPKDAVLCKPVMVGFCGTDNELMNMGSKGLLGPKFPKGRNRLINGHEGIVWVPSEHRFAIVLIRGGDSWDPTRYTEDETYFEYGCDGADGLFCDKQYFHPDMLLRIPDGYVRNGKLDLSFAKKMVFPDPFACMLFQLERMEDLGSAHNFRQTMRRCGCSEDRAREIAKDEIFERTVIFGLGTTGMFIGDLILRSHPKAKVLFVARSSEDSPCGRRARSICKIHFPTRKNSVKPSSSGSAGAPRHSSASAAATWSTASRLSRGCWAATEYTTAFRSDRRSPSTRCPSGLKIT